VGFLGRANVCHRNCNGKVKEQMKGTWEQLKGIFWYIPDINKNRLSVEEHTNSRSAPRQSEVNAPHCF
jgi:predicted nucleic acid-binding Zn ribbon protein